MTRVALRTADGSPRARSIRRLPARGSASLLVLTALLLGSVGTTHATPVTARGSAVAAPRVDYAEIETRNRVISQRAVAATVGLRIGRNLGSGVIVSPEGLILTAGHVIEAPGRRVEITLSDGRVVWGRSLGVNRWIDSGMIEISSEGPWPHLELGEPDSVRRDDWVLALGHPGGVEEGRPPVVRVGRVTSQDARVIRTDCTIVSGDSGGPLVDLQGRVIGIHTSLRPVLVANDHLPVDTYRRTWDRLIAGESWGGSPGGRAILGIEGDSEGTACRVVSVMEGFAADLAGLRVGDVITALEGEDLSGGYPELEQRVSERGVGDPLSLLVDRDQQRLEIEVRLSRYESGDPVRIVRTPWRTMRRTKRDPGLLAGFRQSVRDVRESVVSVVCDGQRVALGTVITADGLIVTKASELQSDVACWIGGEYYEARLLEVDEDYDLALLEIDAEGLKPVAFAEREVEVGQWVVTPGTSELPISVGALSAPPRAIPGRAGFLGVMMDDRDGVVTIETVQEDTSADRAGLRAGDQLLRIDGQEIESVRMLSRALRSTRPRSEVELVYRRGEAEHSIDVRLGSHPIEDENPVEQQNRQAGPISTVRSGFPLAFHHDSVLAPDECGGPVVDREGRAIGLNLARAGRTASYAVPGPRLLRVVIAMRARAGR